MPSSPPSTLAARVGGCLSTALMIPIGLVGFVVFETVLLTFTLTGIGPLIQYCCNRRDAFTLDRDKIVGGSTDMQIITIPGSLHGSTRGRPYQLTLRFTKPSGGEPSKYPPICIPNGLGATLVTISILHEKLVKAGFAVLSFDRLGVGFTDDNPSRRPPSVQDVVREVNGGASDRHAMEGEASGQLSETNRYSRYVTPLSTPSMCASRWST